MAPFGIPGKLQVLGASGGLPARPFVQFTGTGSTNVTSSDDSTNNRTNVIITSTGGGGSSNYNPIVLKPSGGDDTLAAQAALNTIAAQGGGEIIIDGMLKITSALTITSTQGVHIHGTSMAYSGFSAPYNSMFNILTVTNCYQFRVSNLFFTTHNPAGGATTYRTGGKAFVMNSSWFGQIDNCTFYYQFDAIYSTGDSQGTRVINCQCWYFTGNFIEDDHGGNGNEFSVDTVVCYGRGNNTATTNNQCGIKWHGRDPIIVRYASIMMCDYGIYCSSEKVINGVGMFSNTFSDASSAAGIYVNMPSGGLVEFNNCWMGTTGVHTYNISGKSARPPALALVDAHAVRVTGCYFDNNIANAIEIAPACNMVNIENNYIGGGSSDSGIKFQPGATYNQISIKNNHFHSGSWYYGSGSNQPYGIDLSTAIFQSCEFVGNMLSNSVQNIKGGSGLYGGSSGSSLVAQNINWDCSYTVTNPAIPSSGTAFENPFPTDCAVYINGGTINTITIGTKNIGITSGYVRVPRKASITLTYTVAPTWTWVEG